jgi:hypothetical protein
MDFFRSPFLSAIFKPPRRKPGYSPDPASLVSDSGTKVAPLLGSGNRGRAILAVSYRNVSAALSHLKLKLSVQVLKPLLGKPVKSALAPLSRYLVHVMEVHCTTTSYILLSIAQLLVLSLKR